MSETLAVADPVGHAPPPSGAGGSSAKTSVPALRSGSSTGLTLQPLGVAGGHVYTLTIAVSVPAGQVDTAGTTQVFQLEISS